MILMIAGEEIEFPRGSRLMAIWRGGLAALRQKLTMCNIYDTAVVDGFVHAGNSFLP